MKFAIALLLVLLCALGLYFARLARRDEPRIEAAAVSSLSLREQPLAPLAVQDGDSRVPIDDPLASVQESKTAAALAVRVVVLAREDRRPLPGLEVQFAWWSGEGETPIAQATTDALGAVDLRLEAGETARESICTISVGQGDGARRFHAIPLREEIVVLMDSCTRLHGRIVHGGIELSEAAWVQLEEPRVGTMSCAVMLAHAQAGTDGRFEMQACPSRELPLVDVRVMVGSLALTRSIPWLELASEAGARIEVSFGELLVRVRDSDGNPVAGAEVRIAPRSADAPFPAVASSDARGEFRAKLETGSFELIAAAPGFASTIERLEFDAQQLPSSITLVLRRLGGDDRLIGRVVIEDGTPVEGAWVTASPVMDSRDAAMAGHAQIRSGPDGGFELAIATDQELEVVAYRRDLGMSDEVRLWPRVWPRGGRLELVIRAQGKLEVRIHPPSGLAAFANGLVEYALVDRRLEHVDFGHAFEVPFELEELPVGDYLLFVHVAGWSAYAEGSVHIDAQLPARIELHSRPAQWARGRVRSAEGEAIPSGELRLEHPSWPPEVEKLWCGHLASDGRFELFLGAETVCPAKLQRSPGSSQTLQLQAVDGLDLRLR